MAQLNAAYTVTVEQNNEETWNELATDIAFFESEHGARIALKNPLGDDAMLNPDIHSIINVEKGANDNGFPWFHSSGPMAPPDLKADALPADEQHNLDVF